jgi:SOS-response transcriptional repressor LexA
MNDDSMKPLINKGDKLQLGETEEINIGDIVIYQLDDDSYLTRRYFEKEDMIVLVPDNKKYETKEFDKDSIKFIGKVKSIITEL